MTDIPKGPLESVSSYHLEPRELRPLVKRFLDIFGSALLIVFVLPVFLVISAIVFSKVGPRIIFAHEREGKDGRKFKCLKFRTMYLDADARLAEILETDPAARAEWDATRKLKNDTRILPVIGHFLRKSSLDELPQLFNVLIGDMSLVGPRPVVEEEIAFYGDDAALYYAMRPGLTGPWQVGSRSNTDYQTRVALDIHYVRNWTLLGDFMIVVKTTIMVAKLRSDSAY